MIQFEEEYHLSNTIVEIFPLNESHESELFKISNDKEIWKHFTEDGFGRDNFKNYIRNAIQNHRDKQEYAFVIKDLRNNELAGMTRIYAVSNSLKNAKIGHTWIGKKFQGTGLNKACKYLLFEFLFEKLDFERIGFGASALNTKSIKAMESVGCQKEGELRAFLPSENEKDRINIVLLSILRSEWKDRVQSKLKDQLKSYLNNYE